MKIKQHNNTYDASIQYKMISPLGNIFLVASDLGLQGVFLQKQKHPIVTRLQNRIPSQKILSQAIEQLNAYFKGQRKKFDLPFDIQGTEFQKKVWKALSQIPYGKTCSYKDIAQKIKHEKAVRAVGTANGKNPLCIIVPCHRVIAADGSLGGYSGGLNVKQQLLSLEQI